MTELFGRFSAALHAGNGAAVSLPQGIAHPRCVAVDKGSEGDSDA